MKFSKQRELILNTVLTNDNHPTADFIYSKLKLTNPDLSLGTVYRNLAKLSDIGLIKTVHIPNQSDKFDKNMNQHAHLVCDICGKVYDIESSSFYNLTNNISTNENILIKSYNIIFNGVCSNCIDKNK